jgi:hypothetical protein
MTVKELIEILQTKNPNAIVKYTYDGPDAFGYKLVERVEVLFEKEVILEEDK